MSTLFVVQPSDVDSNIPCGVYTGYNRALLEAVKVGLRGASDYGLNILAYAPDEEIQLDTFEDDDWCTLKYVERTVTHVDHGESSNNQPCVIVTVSNEFVKTVQTDIVTIVEAVALALELRFEMCDPEPEDINTVFEFSKGIKT